MILVMFSFSLMFVVVFMYMAVLVKFISIIIIASFFNIFVIFIILMTMAMKIFTFISDGSITLVKTDGSKMKITNYVEKAGGGDKGQMKKNTLGKTLTKEELLDRFSI